MLTNQSTILSCGSTAFFAFGERLDLILARPDQGVTVFPSILISGGVSMGIQGLVGVGKRFAP
jgi:hypothetical protein